MKTHTEYLASIRVKNFKAIKDSKAVRLTPLTVLIGNNGSGKSSLIEALESYWMIVTSGLDGAMSKWMGLEHVQHKSTRRLLHPNFMTFSMTGRHDSQAMGWGMWIKSQPSFNLMGIDEEQLFWGNEYTIHRNNDGVVTSKRFADEKEQVLTMRADPGQSSLPESFKSHIASWQFLSLSPERMALPFPKRMTQSGNLLLNKDGSNIAQYLLYIRERDPAAFDGIVQTMGFVLNYAHNFEPVETQEVQRTMYVRMRERNYSIPGWMLSTGTLRILAFLAVLRNPTPPPLIVIEEIENGLDPRTLNLLLDEIRDAVRAGRTQVIATTHSPYVLDLLPMQTIVLVERDEKGHPQFIRPSKNEHVREWSTRFTAGDLYKTGQLSAKGDL